MFRKALKFCKDNETRLKREKFIRLFVNGDKNKFWKEVRKLNPIKKIDTIDGFSNTNQIIDVFTNKFKNIKDVSQCHQQDCFDNNFAEQHILPCLDIEKAILSLNAGHGHDGINANHLKYAGLIFRKNFCFYNSLSTVSFQSICGQVK